MAVGIESCRNSTVREKIRTRAIELSADSTLDTEKQAMRANVDHNLKEGQNKHAEDTT